MIFGRTGELCSITGRYRCFGNYEVQVTLQQGEYFPQAGDASNVFWMFAGKPEEELTQRSKRNKDRYHS